MLVVENLRIELINRTIETPNCLPYVLYLRFKASHFFYYSITLPNYRCLLTNEGESTQSNKSFTTRWQEINIMRFNKIESGEEKGEETNFQKTFRSEEN
jgi:hypothetical protein